MSIVIIVMGTVTHETGSHNIRRVVRRVVRRSGYRVPVVGNGIMTHGIGTSGIKDKVFSLEI